MICTDSSAPRLGNAAFFRGGGFFHDWPLYYREIASGVDFISPDY